LQSRGRFKREIDQHAACGMRCFAARLTALDYEDARASSSELNRQRESDDAATDDDYIPILHLRIVKDSGAAVILQDFLSRQARMVVLKPLLSLPAGDTCG